MADQVLASTANLLSYVNLIVPRDSNRTASATLETAEMHSTFKRFQDFKSIAAFRLKQDEELYSNARNKCGPFSEIKVESAAEESAFSENAEQNRVPKPEGSSSCEISRKSSENSKRLDIQPLQLSSRVPFIKTPSGIISGLSESRTRTIFRTMNSASPSPRPKVNVYLMGKKIYSVDGDL